MTREEAIRQIVELLDGTEWTPETLDEIASILRSAGCQVRDTNGGQQ